MSSSTLIRRNVNSNTATVNNSATNDSNNSTLTNAESSVNNEFDVFCLKKDTLVYHGTKYIEGNPKWWRLGQLPGSFKDQGDEDGGVSYSLSLTESPKLTNAQVVITYKLKMDLNVIVCKSKAEFYQHLKNGAQACWTRAENELKFSLESQKHHLIYQGDNLGWLSYFFG